MYTYYMVYSFPIAPVANYQKVNGLKKHKFVSWSSGSQKSKQSPKWFLSLGWNQGAGRQYSFLEALGRIHFLDFFSFGRPAHIPWLLAPFHPQSQWWLIFVPSHYSDLPASASHVQRPWWWHWAHQGDPGWISPAQDPLLNHFCKALLPHGVTVATEGSDVDVATS